MKNRCRPVGQGATRAVTHRLTGIQNPALPGGVLFFCIGTDRKFEKIGPPAAR